MKHLKTFWNYYGGKWRVALRYPPPYHDVVVEPFAGAAGYSLRHYRKNVILIDKDPVIYGIWDYLIKVEPEEIMALPDTVEDVDGIDAPQEARWLIGFLLNAGSSAPCRQPSKWMREKVASGEPFAEFWGPKRKLRIASQVSKIKHWKAIHGTYSDAPDVEATWFVDPPYQNAGAFYTCNSGEIDFQHLGNWCQNRKGQVIVCENEGADWLPFEPFHAIKATHGATRKGVSMEVIWTKGCEIPGSDVFFPGGLK